MTRKFGWPSLAVLAACSAPGPTPAEIAAQEPVAATLSDAQRRKQQEDTEAALLALLAGRHDEARLRAEAILARDPGAGRARAILGRSLVETAVATDPPRLDLMERAEGELLLARKQAPQDPEIQLFHAQFLEADGQITLAADVLDQLLAVRPEHLQGLRAASRLRFELGEERRAEKLLARLVTATPKDATAVLRLAHCRFRLADAVARGDTTERSPDEVARREFLRAGESFRAYQLLRPQAIDGLLGEAHARHRAARLLGDDVAQVTKETKAALDLLAGAVAVLPRSPLPHHAKGVILAADGDKPAAKAAYERALQLDPNHLASVLNLAQLLDAMGDVPGARALATRALQLPVTGDERRRLEAYLADTAR